MPTARAVAFTLALCACSVSPTTPTISSSDANTGSTADVQAADTGSPPPGAAAAPDSAAGADSATVACTSSQQCPTGLVCKLVPAAGVCVACLTNADCAGGLTCWQNQCVQPKACGSDKDCAAIGAVCDHTSSICVECVVSADCAAPDECKANLCTPPAAPCKSSKDCGAFEQICDKTAGQCVACTNSSDCPTGAVCKDTLCIQAVCTPSASKCVNSGAQMQCNADGSAWVTSDCGDNAVCADGQCRQLICSANQNVCDGDKVAACNATGTALLDSKACPAGQKCVDGACSAVVCAVGALTCQGASLAACADDGLSWVLSACPSEQGCVAKAGSASCQSYACKPESAFCEGAVAKFCQTNGQPEGGGDDCTQPGKDGKPRVCAGGKCVPQVCAPSQSQCNATGNAVMTCATTGLSWLTAPCAAGKACLDGTCQPVICASKQVFCQGSVVHICNSNGTASTLGQDCKAGGKSCSNGACVDAMCGDAKLNQAQEQCDDGNNTDGDGCSAGCQVEPKCATACGKGTVCVGAEVCAKPCTGVNCGVAATTGDWTEGSNGNGWVIKDGAMTLNAIGFPAKATNLWVANSPNSTVSKIDTVTLKEIGRFAVCSDPSRTAVDFDGNAWIACRGDGKVAKIMNATKDCVDKNLNGVIETSSGAGAGANVLPAGQDECVQFIVQPDGATIARAMAVDKANNVWVGFWNSSNLKRLASADGATLQSINVACNPYGLVIDAKGIVWVQGAGCGNLVRVDPVAQQVTKYPYAAGAYGIAVDKFGNIWTASGGSASRFDPKTLKWDVVPGIASGGRGVAAAATGIVYIASDGSSSVTIIDGNANPPVMLGVMKGANFPVGVAVDKAGFVWAVNQGGSSVTQFDPVAKTAMATVAVGSSPYTYSDMTGNSLQYLGTGAVGVWTGVFVATDLSNPFSGKKLAQWTSLTVDAQVPAGASVQVRLRVAASPGDLATAPWSAPLPWKTATQLDLSGGAVMGMVLAVEMTLNAAPDGKAPVVAKVEAGLKTW